MLYKNGEYNLSKTLLEDLKTKYDYDDIYAQLFIVYINYKLSISLRNKPDE